MRRSSPTDGCSCRRTRPREPRGRGCRACERVGSVGKLVRRSRSWSVVREQLVGGSPSAGARRGPRGRARSASDGRVGGPRGPIPRRGPPARPFFGEVRGVFPRAHPRAPRPFDTPLRTASVGARTGVGAKSGTEWERRHGEEGPGGRRAERDERGKWRALGRKKVRPGWGSTGHFSSR